MTRAKGLDDFLVLGGNPKLRRHFKTPAAVSQRRAPYDLAERAPVRSGAPLKDVRATVARRIDGFVKDAWRNRGKALPIFADPGTGKSTTVAKAITELGVNARVVMGTKTLAKEFGARHGFQVVEGRNANNCLKYELVSALGESGFPVGKMACGTEQNPICPFFSGCGYQAQMRDAGPKVGTTEQLFNPRFLEGGDMLVVDDADLARAMLRTRLVGIGALQRAVEQLAGRKREPARMLTRLLGHAVLDAPREWIEGPAFWDHLDKAAANSGLDIDYLIEALPKTGSLLNPGDGKRSLTAADVRAVPPANLGVVFHALKEELEAWRSGRDFNSRLRLNSSGIEVAHVRDHPRDRDGFFISRMPLLILDATPIESLVRKLARHHALLPPVFGEVHVPQNVTVVQYARATNGHSVMKNEAAIAAVKTEIREERRRHPVAPEHEALIVFMASLADFYDLGFLPAHRLHFGGSRGTNVVEHVLRLHVAGRPMPPTSDTWYLAQVIHHDEEFVSKEMVLRPAEYAGWAKAVDVVDYADRRMAELLRAARESELIQVVNRARLATMDEEGSARTHLRVVLHTSHPIPGLRIDELHLGRGHERSVNDDRQDVAEQKVRRAVEAIKARGERVTIQAVAREAEVEWRTAKKVLERIGMGLHTPSEAAGDHRQVQDGELGNALHTLWEERGDNLVDQDGEGHGKGLHTLYKGTHNRVQSGPMSSPPTNGLCRGGCGTPMPEGQSCGPCAERAVEEWKRRRGRGVG